jgi:hypothetical protein
VERGDNFIIPVQDRVNGRDARLDHAPHDLLGHEHPGVRLSGAPVLGGDLHRRVLGELAVAESQRADAGGLPRAIGERPLRDDVHPLPEVVHVVEFGTGQHHGLALPLEEPGEDGAAGLGVESVNEGLNGGGVGRHRYAVAAVCS